LLNKFLIIYAPNTERIQIILPGKSSHVASIGRLHYYNSTIENPLPVSFIDQVIGQTPKQYTRAELQHTFRQLPQRFGWKATIRPWLNSRERLSRQKIHTTLKVLSRMGKS
jgi:hypothetical protein